jgi:hypothetical protein
MFTRDDLIRMLREMERSCHQNPKQSDWCRGFDEGLAFAFRTAAEWLAFMNEPEKGGAA